MLTEGEPVRVRMENISKAFGAIKSLDSVNLVLRAGEVLGLVGDNGAGKSTLSKVLSGAIVPDEGRIVLDGKEVRSCITALSDVTPNQEITTLEGLPARWAKQKGLSAEEAKTTLHPVQQAWIEEQTPQCGFCQNGMIIKATELLESNPHPTTVQIKEAFTTSGVSPNLCRCGTYVAIIEAVKHAAVIMEGGR